MSKVSNRIQREESKKKRNHRANGQPHGGYRPGGGRITGTKLALVQGAARALAAIGYRVPKDAPESAKKLAGYALERVVDVMAGKVHYSEVQGVLKAASNVREEICGSIAKQVNVKGEFTWAQALEGLDEPKTIEADYKEVKALAEKIEEEPKVVVAKGPVVRKKVPV